MTDKDKLASVENSLVQRYNERGFLLEDEVLDCCVDNDLDLAEIDAVCDRLLKRNIIFRDSESVKIVDEEDGDEIYDRSHLDYDDILNRIKKDYPNCQYFVEEIRSILPPQHKEWRTLIKEAQSGNKYAKDRIVLMYLRTMLKQAYVFSKSYYCDFEDSFQNAVIGLIIAIDKFDVTSPDSFVSYFPLWARQVMNRECIVDGTIFRFPVHYKDQFVSIVNGLIDTEIGPDCIANTDLNVIAEYVKSEDYYGVYNEIEKQFSLLYKAEYEIISDCKFDYNHIIPYLPLLDDYICDDFEEQIVIKERNKKIRDIIDSSLRDREKDVIIKRYGIDDGVEKTLEEVGQIYGVTRERVRQIEKKALDKLKKYIKRDMFV